MGKYLSCLSVSCWIHSHVELVQLRAHGGRGPRTSVSCWICSQVGLVHLILAKGVEKYASFTLDSFTSWTGTEWNPRGDECLYRVSRWICSQVGRDLLRRGKEAFPGPGLRTSVFADSFSKMAAGPPWLAASAAWAPGPAQPHQKDARNRLKTCFRCSPCSRNCSLSQAKETVSYRNRKNSLCFQK
jgi:hypothetical protein